MEYYLKGIGERPALHAQIQRNDGEWRIEETGPLSTPSGNPPPAQQAGLSVRPRPWS